MKTPCKILFFARLILHELSFIFHFFFNENCSSFGQPHSWTTWDFLSPRLETEEVE